MPQSQFEGWTLYLPQDFCESKTCVNCHLSKKLQNIWLLVKQSESGCSNELHESDFAKASWQEGYFGRVYGCVFETDLTGSGWPGTCYIERLIFFFFFNFETRSNWVGWSWNAPYPRQALHLKVFLPRPPKSIGFQAIAIRLLLCHTCWGAVGGMLYGLPCLSCQFWQNVWKACSF